MPVAHEQVTIVAPPDRVFAALTQVERLPEWVPYVLQVRRTSTVVDGPGFEAGLVVRISGRESKGTGRVLEWEPSSRVVLEVDLDVGVKATATCVFEPDGEGTRLAATVDYAVTRKGLGRFAAGFVAGALGRDQLKRALAFVKERMEVT